MSVEIMYSLENAVYTMPFRDEEVFSSSSKKIPSSNVRPNLWRGRSGGNRPER